MSILPPPQKDGEIKFFIAKSLPYRVRMALVALLLAAGVGLQLTLGFWPGLALLVLGQLLGMNSGYDAAPHITGEQSWERVTPDEYEKVRLKAEELNSWDQDFFDGTNTSGVIGFAAVMLLCAVGYGVLAVTWKFPDGTWIYFGLDAAVILVPLWFIGTRDYLKKDRLVIKIDLLKRLMEALNDPSDVQVQPMLALDKTESGGREPEDARLMIKLVGAPKEFYGVQAQISVNSVQGKDYPYLYCVLIAKSGSGLLNNYQSLVRREEKTFLQNLASAFLPQLAVGDPTLVYEPQGAGEVDIIVIRQETTRNSGYYTSPGAALAVTRSSLELAKGLLKLNSAKAV